MKNHMFTSSMAGMKQERTGLSAHFPNFMKSKISYFEDIGCGHELQGKFNVTELYLSL